MKVQERSNIGMAVSEKLGRTSVTWRPHVSNKNLREKVVVSKFIR